MRPAPPATTSPAAVHRQAAQRQQAAIVEKRDLPAEMFHLSVAPALSQFSLSLGNKIYLQWDLMAVGVIGDGDIAVKIETGFATVLVWLVAFGLLLRESEQ
jgi:hypothetical protein